MRLKAALSSDKVWRLYSPDFLLQVNNKKSPVIGE